MEKFWKEALKVTGSVAVIGFLLALVIKSIFQEGVLSTFGSDQVFYLVVLILSVLGIALFLALILNSKRAKEDEDQDVESDSRTVSIDKSKIDGDIVLGNKTINQDHKRDE